MSVCVVAAYPWTAIRDKPFVRGSGIIVCSDTRATSRGQPLSWLYGKQRFAGPNILVCFTTTNGHATSAALKRTFGTRNVRRIGKALRDVHQTCGGLTELLAVVWPGKTAPRILEVMPPDYRPRLRTGIVGIGQRTVLQWFKEHFGDDPTPDLPPMPPSVALEAFHRQFGPTTFPEPEFTVADAAIRVIANLAEAISQVGDSTVGRPLQVMTIQHGIVTRLPIVQTADLQVWEDVTANAADLRAPVGVVPRVAKDTRRLTAIQLFD